MIIVGFKRKIRVRYLSLTDRTDCTDYYVYFDYRLPPPRSTKSMQV